MSLATLGTFSLTNLSTSAVVAPFAPASRIISRTTGFTLGERVLFFPAVGSPDIFPSILTRSASSTRNFSISPRTRSNSASIIFIWSLAFAIEFNPFGCDGGARSRIRTGTPGRGLRFSRPLRLPIPPCGHISTDKSQSSVCQPSYQEIFKAWRGLPSQPEGYREENHSSIFAPENLSTAPPPALTLAG